MAKRKFEKRFVRNSPEEQREELRRHEVIFRKSEAQVRGFVDFIGERGVFGLAVGFILGGAITRLVTALVIDIINPVVGVFLGLVGGLKSAYVQVGPAKILWGDFINNVIDFLIIALIVYFAAKILRLEKLDKKKK